MSGQEMTTGECLAWEKWNKTGQWDATVCAAAAFLGKLDEIKVAAETNPNNLDFQFMFISSDVFAAAARGGHIHILTWMYERGHRPNGQGSACTSAAYGNQDATLKWLHEKGFRSDESTCANIAFRGNLPLLQWARARGCPWNEYTCESAAEGGHLVLLQWCRAQDPPCPWSTKTLAKAIEHRHQSIVMWLRFKEPTWH